MKMLITGCNGLLGQKLVYKLKVDKEVSLCASSLGENRLFDQSDYQYRSLDVTQKIEVDTIIAELKPDCVIHTASMTNVDACEDDKEGCTRLNVNAVQYLAEACEKHNVHLVHLSTDFVFDGKSGPYREEDKPNPLNFYGKSKLEAEKILYQGSAKSAIVRTILVYGVAEKMDRSNIVLWAKQALENHKKIHVVSDQFRSPTLVEDLADGCIFAAKKQIKGIYHVSGKNFLSVLEIVQNIADFWKRDKNLITPIDSITLSQKAKRPLKTGFILDKAIRDLDYRPHSFRQGLAIVDKQLQKN